MFRLPSIHPKIHTNARLTNEEETEVRRAMSEALDRHEIVESEIARLEGRYDVLDQRMTDTEKLIGVYEGAISHIRRVAPEILQEIFWQCLPIAHNSMLNLEDVPLVLCRVCSQWRQIAYSTPKLWSSIHFAATPRTPGSLARLEAIDAWLTRSGILPLSISMYIPDDRSQSAGLFRPYFDLILKYVRRWKCVRLQVETRDPMDFLTEITADDLPLLEEFHIIRDPYGLVDEPMQVHGKDGFLFAPSLRVLSINDVSVRLPDLPVQFGKLTGLGLETPCLDLASIVKVLTSCPHLESCALTVGKVSFQTIPILQSSDSGSGIVLPKLRTLKIHGRLSQDSDFLTLLGGLSTPALRHFAYGPSYYYSPWSTPGTTEHQWSSAFNCFRSFFQRLNEPLQELDLQIGRLKTSYAMEFLSLFPELKRLSLKYSSSSLDPSHSLINDRLLQDFIPYDHRSHCHTCSSGERVDEPHDPTLPPFACLCPKLEVLKVNTALVSKHTLFEFLGSRLIDYDKYNIGHLRHFSITFSLTIKERIGWEEVDRLSNDSGVPTKLRYHYPLYLYLPASTAGPQRPQNGCRDGIQEIFGVEST